MAPPGTKVVVFEPHDKCPSWIPHGQVGWYIGPEIHYYKCHKTYIIKTSAENISDTIEFFPTSFPMPKLSAADAAIHAANLLIEALNMPHPMSPLNNFPIQQQQALRKLADIFSTALT